MTRLRRQLGLVLVVLIALPAAAAARPFAGFTPDVGGGRPASGHRVGIDHPRAFSPLARIANLPYEGGQVLHTNRTHVIFWAPTGTSLAFPDGYAALIEVFLANVAADSHRTTNVYSLSGQYTDDAGAGAYDSTYGGAVAATDPLPATGCTEPATAPPAAACVSDSGVEAEIAHVVAANNLPTSDHDIYILVLPQGLGVCEYSGPTNCALGGTSSGSFCGYHSVTADSSLLYDVIPYNAVPGHCQSGNPRPNSNPADPAISTISHEHNETVTDPYGDAWIDSAGNEDGDLCISHYGDAIGGSGGTAWNQTIHGGHYFLQQEWSNWDGGCASRAKPIAVTFSSRTPAQPGSPVAFTAHAHPAHGSVTAYTWYFGDNSGGRGRQTNHTFVRGGSYRIVLRITDSAGLWSFNVRTVRVGRSHAHDRHPHR
jgi:PKD domain